MLPKGPRPPGPLPSGQTPEPAPPPPSPARRSRPFPAALRPLLFAAAGALLALGVLLLYRAILPPPRPLTAREVQATVERVLKERPPEPAMATKAYAAVQPSLVFIEARGPLPLGSADLPGGGVSVGTGLVVEDSGTILTSQHVVEGAAEIRVIFADGSESGAAIVVAQPENDLAVLQPAVVPDDLVPATLAGSGRLNVGDEVVAVGTPFGIATPCRPGWSPAWAGSIVSPRAGVPLKNLIQFDAAVNPGNSGGPLVNRDGEVVGIVTGLLNPTDQDVFIGIGFAVTIETAGGGAGHSARGEGEGKNGR